MRGLSGKSVIVTGGASGIGRETALRLCEEGCAVSIFDLNAEGAEETARLGREKGSVAAGFRVDISDREAVAAALRECEALHGPTALLAKLAGWATPCNFLDPARALWYKVIQINLYGALVMHHVVVPGMVERQFGRVVNVSSDAGRVGSSGEAVYAACKGGMIAFTKTLARELARHSIKIGRAHV